MILTFLEIYNVAPGCPEDEQPKVLATHVPDLRVTVLDLEEFGHTDVGFARCAREHASGCPGARFK